MHCAEARTMPITVKVTKSYRVAYADPIKLVAGERVQLAHEDQQWSGWIWCKTRGGQTGWAPKQIFLPAEEGQFLVGEDYDATELDVAESESVDILFELNGWAWCRAAGRGAGWVPKDNLSDATNRRP